LHLVFRGFPKVWTSQAIDTLNKYVISAKAEIQATAPLGYRVLPRAASFWIPDQVRNDVFIMVLC